MFGFIKDFLNRPAFFNPDSEFCGMSWFQLLVNINSPGLVQFLLLLGADPNKKIEDDDNTKLLGYNALHLAAEAGHLDVVKVLLQNGANIADTIGEHNTELGNVNALSLSLNKNKNPVSKFLFLQGERTPELNQFIDIHKNMLSALFFSPKINILSMLPDDCKNIIAQLLLPKKYQFLNDNDVQKGLLKEVSLSINSHEEVLLFWKSKDEFEQNNYTISAVHFITQVITKLINEFMENNQKHEFYETPQLNELIATTLLKYKDFFSGYCLQSDRSKLINIFTKCIVDQSNQDQATTLTKDTEQNLKNELHRTIFNFLKERNNEISGEDEFLAEKIEKFLQNEDFNNFSAESHIAGSNLDEDPVWEHGFVA